MSKKLKGIIAASALLVFSAISVTALSACSCEPETDEPTPEPNEELKISAISITNKAALQAEYSETEGPRTLELAITSNGSTNAQELMMSGDLTVNSSDTKVATVTGLQITPVSAGKTTITNLLNRFYDINSGKIRYDGINIEKIKKDDLRHSLGMVLQDTNLFTGTIKENIKYGKSNATDDEVIQAAKLANADNFIRRLPNGYDTMLTGNGSELSQGQRQLLAIARCAINNPPVMILDEATSSIDTRTEKIVQDGMDKLMEGRTVLVIAHRLSTVRNSKAIMVLDHGRIIERGDHNQLIDQKGTYYQLYTGAFELE